MLPAGTSSEISFSTWRPPRSTISRRTSIAFPDTAEVFQTVEFPGQRPRERTMPSPTELRTWREREVVDVNGKPIGHLDEIYRDDSTGGPAFLLVKGGIF